MNVSPPNAGRSFFSGSVDNYRSTGQSIAADQGSCTFPDQVDMSHFKLIREARLPWTCGQRAKPGETVEEFADTKSKPHIMRRVVRRLISVQSAAALHRRRRRASARGRKVPLSGSVREIPAQLTPGSRYSPLGSSLNDADGHELIHARGWRSSVDVDDSGRSSATPRVALLHLAR